ncbi:benzoate 4-monooxygenase cytochrome P450 [Metarhizium guizhouense ARSEF 977]|uniref:Benzoate 4-monooxygenase cytochrome P450 n=1 Tax=Metarhizium guizhouense (strain ARSEF 977) TaxID=1276136 RepID=A0A0B4GN12_METGA|nr:benzoate 4-monooxygenase cytochrome P450 [Metarhizium guizhouense ARSEF 977]
MSFPLGCTPISSSSYILHRDASIFPDLERFDPERWVKAAQNGDNLKKYLTSFTRGSRACIGINLAYMELFLTVAHLFRRFDMELYDTEAEDVRIVRDMNMGYTRRGNLRVYAKLSLAEREG